MYMGLLVRRKETKKVRKQQAMERERKYWKANVSMGLIICAVNVNMD